VATVHDFKKSNLWVASQVNVLGAVSYELHKTTTCHFVYPMFTKKIWRNAKTSFQNT
jgi:hypothetical protein